MLTLTIDPERFEGPRQAHDLAHDKRWLSELMRVFGVRNWIAVMEIQPVSKFPHWHVLIDRRVDVVKVRAWWTARCGVRPARRQTQVNIKWFIQPAKAINYVTGYLTKGCEDPPDWVLDHDRVVRMLSHSESVQSWSSWLKLKGKPRSEPDEKRSPFDRRIPSPRTRHLTLRHRLAACGASSVMLSEALDKYGRVVRRTALCSLPLSIPQLEAWLTRSFPLLMSGNWLAYAQRDFEMAVTQWGRGADGSWVPEILSGVRVKGFILAYGLAERLRALFGGSSKGERPLRLAG